MAAADHLWNDRLGALGNDQDVSKSDVNWVLDRSNGLARLLVGFRMSLQV